jgi:hypothetical protein
MCARGEAMPRYYFNVHFGQDVLPDPGGQDLRDPDQAWEVTNLMARSLMTMDFPQPINWAACHIEVKDEAGEIVLEFPFLEAVEVPRPPN